MTWTSFWDMHSGGSSKEKWEHIYIQAPRQEAISVFYIKFGHNPERVSCTCCGSDYSIYEDETLLEATGFHRGCARSENSDGYIDAPGNSTWNKYRTQEEYEASGQAKFIHFDEIKSNERNVTVPNQGYVWQ